MDLLSTNNLWENWTSTGNAAHTFEQAFTGYDPSIGRTPVEQVNNYATIALAITTNSVIKGGPGFLHKIILRAGQAADFEIHDHISSNSALLFKSGAIASPAAPIVIEFNTLITAGIVLRNTHATQALAVGDLIIVYR